ncbi:C40 family peptidase [Treponema sp. R6D11]
MRVILPLLLIFITFNVFAAPLESGYALAPKATASPEDKTRVYQDLREKVIETAKKYEGIPYRYGGMTISGLDCSGFLCLVFKEALNVALPRSASGLYSWVEKTTFDKAQPGDFLFFKTDFSGKITHVGLYLGERRFIHSASTGPKTGVIYSSLDEKYWANSYVGAGRAFPETASNIKGNNNSMAGASSAGGKGSKSSAGTNTGTNTSTSASAIKPASSKQGSRDARLLVGVAFAPIWNGFILDGDMFRGFTSQLGINADIYPFGFQMIFGLELRPEYDGGLGVFRLPITFSFGPNDKIRLFAGPVFSFGDASLSIKGNKRYYSGGTSWFGTAGITLSPFVFKSSAGEIAPYVEAAWQSYYSDNADVNVAADFSANFRFSTGIRWLIKVL